MKRNLKKLGQIILGTSMAALLIITLIPEKAHAELKKDDYEFRKTCAIVIDSNKNNITKHQPKATATGACSDYLRGYYFKDKWDKYYTITIGFFKVKYSGEPFIIDTDTKAVVYLTNSSKKLKKNQIMHVAKDKKINVRKTASAKGKIVTSVKQDKTVKVVYEKGGWVKVIANKKYGWVPRKYLVNTVTVNTVVKKVTKAGTDYLESEALLKGQREVLDKGIDGKTTTVYKTRYMNGKKIYTKTYFKVTEQKLMNATVLIGIGEPIKRN